MSIFDINAAFLQDDFNILHVTLRHCFSGLATGGNVSAAMSAMGERVTYGSFLTFTNQLLLLGKNTFHVLVIRSWDERIDYLVKSDRYVIW